MTHDAFAAWLTAIDPAAKHYHHAGTKGAYTIWREYGRLPAFSDNQNKGGWKIQIDRYTKVEDDTVASAIAMAIDESDLIACQHEVDYDDESGYIRHIFDCEVWM
ncbi:MAG: hypothetical protein RR482_00065 [Clostridia bacterium]